MIYKKSEQGEKETTLSKLKQPLKQVQKVLVITLMLVGLGINVGFANEGENSGLLTVFHIYSEGKYIGILSDEAKLEKLKEQELQKAASEFENLPLTIGTDLSVVPERVFTAGTDDEIVLEKLHEMLTVEAEAVGITIDGKHEFYVSDMRAYDEVIRRLKLQSVHEMELSEFEARTVSSVPIPALKENETRIAKVVISGKVQAEIGKTAPEEVKSLEEALVLLNKGTLDEKKYVVQSGDVLGKIAVTYTMTTAKLLELNPSFTVESVLQLGDELNVTSVEPYVEVEVHYETMKKEMIKHKSITEEDSSLYKGEKKVIRQGSDGEKEVTELIRKQNGEVIGRSVSVEKVLVEAQDEVTVIGTKVMPSRGTGTFTWPADGGYVSSQRGVRWGRVHEGIDIAQPSSYTIKVADNGVVTDAGWHSTYGNRIVVTHNNGYETLYAHLSSIDVEVGQTVPQGTEIGIMGSTGRSTGTHLHFEVLKDGENINPLSVLR
ncbi:M23 family metallopeptidase [Sporosarcina limicola]|uniref:Murein DD-endopeptidase MepM/ murein hydrolase activator NlpD n=1 Tax=Sporosarcina limicola TaxID=34101 RepID=A0A927REN6_9BACL|nr:M23 family metallopeptidase [Sporosarcina limicola]MBE1556500.1 murein DD-endopeptidase MepM/ murein hydrolase activator NlpD [Sporosarcina limicola]